MLPEQVGLLASFFSRSRRNAATRTKTTPAREQSICARSVSVEQLEDRRLLVSRVFLDFGDAFPVAPPVAHLPVFSRLGYTQQQLWNTLAGAGHSQVNTSTVDWSAGGLHEYDYSAGHSDFRNDVDGRSIRHLSAPILLQWKQSITDANSRALEPFDIQVFVFGETVSANF